jgi:hypothetical protein
VIAWEEISILEWCCGCNSVVTVVAATVGGTEWQIVGPDLICQ